MVLPKERPSGAAIRLGRDWHAPLGGVLICACGAFSLLGFPLDDVWHRLFGQDVTLWGPTHLMLIGGASMTLVGIAVLAVEGRRAAGLDGTALALGRTRGRAARRLPARAVDLPGRVRLRRPAVPLRLRAADDHGRRGRRPGHRADLGRARVALAAVAFFLAIRGLLALLVGPVLGQPTPHMPLYIVEAVVVELVALRWTRAAPRRLRRLGGLGIGTVGLAAEWAWSHVWMPLPWPAELVPRPSRSRCPPPSRAARRRVIGPAHGVGRRARARPAPRGGARRGHHRRVVGVALHKPADAGVTPAST
jgi:hypothetical protein